MPVIIIKSSRLSIQGRSRYYGCRTKPQLLIAAAELPPLPLVPLYLKPMHQKSKGKGGIDKAPEHH